MKWMAMLLLATPAVAQNRQIIDYDALFRDRAAEVVTSDGGGGVVETLTMPNGIVVYRQNGEITAWDEGGGGAVGCLFMIYVDVGDTLRACPRLGTAEERARHGEYLSQISAFVAENAYPPMALSEVEALVERLQGRADAETCARFEAPDMAGILEGFLGPENGEFLDKALSTPRLPVNNPCL